MFTIILESLYIKDYKQFLKSIKNDRNNLGEVSYFLDQIKKNKKIKYKILNSWFDVGDTNSYKKLTISFRISIFYRKMIRVFFLLKKKYINFSQILKL